MSEHAASLPLFYRQPEALNPNQHAKLYLRASGNFLFGRDANSVPVMGGEFLQAMRFYPIVFAGEAAAPVAILGLEKTNLLIGPDGQWLAGHYIPAYMRRYPFVFIAHPDGKQLILGIDRACAWLEESDQPAAGAQALFADGKPSQLVQDALRFCGVYQNDHQHTAEFCTALLQQDLLVANQAQATLSGRQFNVGGFRIVDKKKFAELPDAVVAEWHKKGWLALVNFHFASLEGFQSLLELHSRTASAAK
jgi:hypothetical protein